MLLRKYLGQGWSTTIQVRTLGISRRSIYHLIDTGQLERDLDEEPVRYRPRSAVARTIDPRRAVIDQRLEEFP